MPISESLTPGVPGENGDSDDPLWLLLSFLSSVMSVKIRLGHLAAVSLTFQFLKTSRVTVAQ